MTNACFLFILEDYYHCLTLQEPATLNIMLIIKGAINLKGKLYNLIFGSLIATFKWIY
uniref:Uncharacterized protein n=1 Tax=Rhizophora mucronata TaxID=61149 RepID=A0A2P2PSZ6_RHIMU